MELQECAVGECQDDSDLSVEETYRRNGNVVAYLAQTFRNRFRFRSRNTVKLQQKKQQQIQQRQRRQGNAAASGEIRESVGCGKCMVDRRDLPWCLLPPSALWKCADSLNRPLWICDRLAQELANVKYSDNFTSRERLAFLSAIDKLSKSIGTRCVRGLALKWASQHNLNSDCFGIISCHLYDAGECERIHQTAV